MLFDLQMTFVLNYTLELGKHYLSHNPALQILVTFQALYFTCKKHQVRI